MEKGRKERKKEKEEAPLLSLGELQKRQAVAGHQWAKNFQSARRLVPAALVEP